jgi:O-antigen/teichoic acid export membrane protein
VWFTPALGLLLGGYLFFSKSFAYLHVPGTPVFVGEIVLGIGIFEVLGIPSPWRHLLTRAPVLKVVLAFLGVSCVRLFFDYPGYGLDALRDASIGYYGAFALLAAAAAVCEPTFVPRLLGWYRRVLPAFLVWAPFAIVLSDVDALSGIVVPGTTTGVNSFKVGDFGVQIATAVAFLWLDGPWRRGERTRSPSRTIALSIVGLVGLFVCLTQSRGGFLGGAATLLVVALYLPSGKRRRLVLPLVGALAAITLLVSLLNVRLPVSGREVSLRQVSANITSIVERKKSEQLSGTVEWREQLWHRIRDDMLSSGAWRTGLGFGVVLGERYGVSDPSDPRPLRNAHNSHLTIFARMGAAGLGVWALLWLVWSFCLVRWIRRRPGGVRDPDAAIAVWLLAGALGHLVNAYFDPSLEGPQACIWLYVLVGIGAALTRSRRPSSGPGPRGGAQLSRQNSVRAAARRNVAGRFRRVPQLQGVAKRLSWGVADQAISSFTNFIVGLWVARSLGPTGFGAFSIAFATYLIALNASRGLATDPLLVRFSGVDLEAWRGAVAGSTGTAIAVGVVGGAVCVVVGIVLAAPTDLPFIALGVTMPGLLLQDSWRFAFLAAGRGRDAFVNDSLWGATLLVLLAIVVVSGWSNQFSFMLAWGSSATIAALVGAAQARVLPRVSAAGDWLRGHRDLSSRYLGENLSIMAANQGRFYGLAAVAGLAIVGSLRAADLLLGPVMVLILGMAMMAVPEAARALRRAASRLWTFCVRIAIVGAGSAVIWGAVVLLLPDRLGRYLLGASWDAASSLVLPATLGVAALGIQLGAWGGVRALGAAKRSLRAQSFGSALYLAGSIVGGIVGGAAGAAWGGAGTTLIGAGYWWWQLHAGLRSLPKADDQPVEDATASPPASGAGHRR